MNTIIIPITREWALEDLFSCLDGLDIERSETELILYLDTDNPKIKSKCSKYIENANWSHSMIAESGKPGPTEVRIAWRRDRIVENHEAIKKLIDPKSEYVIGFEDDTLFPADCAKKLLEHIKRPEVGFVEGVQVGRWSYKYIGAWKVDCLLNTHSIESVMPKDGVEEIDAGGFYCFMTKAELYKKVKITWHDECFGPDVCYGLALKKLGYKNYIDWSIICGHNDHGKILIPDSDVVKLKYNKTDKWRLEVQ